jgi:outer membrane protein, multidrug efflux system
LRILLRSFAPLTAALVASLACNLAPNYQRPALSVPDGFEPAPVAAGGAEASGSVAAADIDWRSFFADERLRTLIAQALGDNRDLRVAVLDIERARAQYGIQRSQFFPNISVDGNVTAQRTPQGYQGAPAAQTSHSYNATIGFSAYELDLFGRVRNLNDQALQLYLSTREARRATQISLVAEVANAWLTWGADRELLSLARETLRARGEAYALMQQRFALGNASQLSLRQLETSLDIARIDVSRYVGQAQLDRHALELLVGSPVKEELAPQGVAEQINPLPELPAGLPSEVLLRRPDLLQSEHQLRAATANIGAARAAFYPRISLTASAGTSSNELSNLFTRGWGLWSFIPQISLPIFNGGANQANLDDAQAAQGIAVAQYEKAIQVAFREVADALTLRSTLSEQLSAEQSLVEANDDALRLSSARFSGGIDSYIEVLDAQRSLYSAQQTLINTRLSRLSNGVTLYKALGGGWSESPEDARTGRVESVSQTPG